MNTLHKLNTNLCADSVEWCPYERFKNYFVCGTYQLETGQDSSSQTRLGNIILFSLEPNELKLHQTLNTAAILDQKWCHYVIEDHFLLAVVNADSTLEIYNLDANTINLHLIASCKLNESKSLILSVDWSTGKHPTNRPFLVATDSRGFIYRIGFDLINRKLELISKFQGHSFEAWSSCFYYWDPNVYFSGGDDLKFYKFDSRVRSEPVAKNCSHEAGVTSIHANREREFIVATGSYDTYLRLFDIRTMKAPLNFLEMPGPVWRIKWDPLNCNDLLIACMSEGAHVVRDEDSNLKITNSYHEHKSMVYGVDWSYLDDNDKKTVATCSFYDKLLCVCNFNLV